MTVTEMIIGRQYNFYGDIVTLTYFEDGGGVTYTLNEVLTEAPWDEFVDQAFLISPSDVTIPGEEYDACEGVSCTDTECVGVDKYSQVCDDGICVRGVLIEQNSPGCGYLTPAKGVIKTISWEACHDRGGCSKVKAYWGSRVTVSVDATNIGETQGGFRIKLVNAHNVLDVLSDLGFFMPVDPGQTSRFKAVFTMPSAPLLRLNVELIRNV